MELSPPWAMEERDGERRRVLLKSKWNLKREEEPLTTNSSPQPSPRSSLAKRGRRSRARRCFRTGNVPSLVHGFKARNFIRRILSLRFAAGRWSGQLAHVTTSPKRTP